MKEDWIECELDDLCCIYPGIGFPKNKQGKRKGLYPFYKVGDISKNFLAGNQLLRLCDNYIDEGDIKNIKNKILPPKSIVFAKIGEALKLNRRGITMDFCLVDNNAIGLKAERALNDLFLYFFFLTIRLEKYSRATTVPSVRKSDIETIRIPLAPLPEQRAIVAKIEELFSSLDSGIADLKKAQDQLVIYRRAVLGSSFNPLKEYIPLKDCGIWKGGGTPSKQVKEYWDNGLVPWVSSRDVKTKDIFDTERHITELAIPNSSTKWIDKEAILFVVRSGILRRIFPIAIAKSDLCVNQDIQTLTLNDNFYSEYVYWFLVGKESNIRHTCSKDGTTVESIDSNKLKSYKIPYCNLIEQHQIVQEIESRLSVCDKVEESIVESLEKAKALRQSILKKAFEGKLLSEQEVAACKKEADYEPASVLLKRIKAEASRQTQGKKTTPAKKVLV